MLVLVDRILLGNGISLVTDERASELIFKFGDLPDHIKVAQSDTAEKYKMIFDKDISNDGVESLEKGQIKEPTEDELCHMLEKLFTKRDNKTSDEEHNERLIRELSFFEKHELIPFLVSCYKLVSKFKENGVVWGVGRGSSCASYVLFLLEVHDINSIKYKISFSEFSKESEQ